MKISLNTIKQYIGFELPPVDELVARINQQLGQVEEVVDLAPKYKDVIIVKVVECEKHPNADRLSVCLIDDGGMVQDIERDEKGLVRVVCGAPNARAGIFAAWLPPKSVVPASYGDAEPFVLDARDLRGVKSNGMLAAADELDLGSGHAGIIEIDPSEWKPGKTEIKPGASFAEAFGLDDTIIDIENKMFTHRPDCFGQIGVAREIAGILGHKFTSPDWYAAMPTFTTANNLKLNVFNEAAEKCPRFMAVAVQGVAVKPSPLWLQIELVRLGSKAINNVVDATNYVMLLTAQPTHAYDYDKLRGATLGARMAKPGETCSLLNGKSYQLTEDDIVIVDGEGIVGLGGVMGGGNSEVSAETKNIVLECADFDMYAVRKTSMRHGMFTDAVTRFSKGQSPLQQPHVMSLLMQSTFDVAGGEQASEVFDYHSTANSDAVVVSDTFINRRLGTEIVYEDIEKLLSNVEFTVELTDTRYTETIMGDTVGEYTDKIDTPRAGSRQEERYARITAPFWRTDIELPEDIVEEVGRLYGFDKLPLELPRRSITPAPENPAFALKKHIRETLSRAGANEVLTYSFVHEGLLKKAGQDATQAFRLSNALSPDLQYYRLSLTPSLLDKVHMNIKAGHDEFALFEIGKAHRVGDEDEEGLPREYNRLAFVYAAKKSDATAYFTAKRYLEALTPGCQYVPLEAFTTEHDIFKQLAAPFEPRRAAVIMDGEKLVGVLGEYKASVTAALKLPKTAAGFEMFLSHLANVAPRAYRPLSRFPRVTQDISLRVTTDIPYDAVYSCAEQVIDKLGETYETSLEPLSIYQPDGESTHKTISLRLTVANYEKTLTDKQVVTMLDQVSELAARAVHAERI